MEKELQLVIPLTKVIFSKSKLINFRSFLSRVNLDEFKYKRFLTKHGGNLASLIHSMS